MPFMKKAKVKTRFGATIYAKPLIYEIMILERLYLKKKKLKLHLF